MSKFPKQVAAERVAQVKNANAPRTMKELTEEYTQLAVSLGNLRYQELMLAQEATNTANAMLACNQEAAERQKLDSSDTKKEQGAILDKMFELNKEAQEGLAVAHE